MGLAQETMEAQANNHRQPAEAFRVGDRVYLRLKNWATGRPSKKLDWMCGTYTVKEAIGTHAVRLDTPPPTHPVFHVSLVKRAASDPLPSQKTEPWQPGPITATEAEADVNLSAGEYRVEAILGRRMYRKNAQVLVKWVGWDRPTWEPEAELEETEALEQFRQKERAQAPTKARKRVTWKEGAVVMA